MRSAGSMAENYIAAGKKDLRFRIKVCRKEAKESKLWLNHVLTYGERELEKERLVLIQEALELELIFGAILKKLLQKNVADNQ